GTESKLTFKGENPVVDRRSIVFTGTEKKKEDPAAAESSGPKNMVDLNAPDEPAAESHGSPSASEASPEPEPMDSGDVPPSVDERPGGGCHYGAHDQGGWALGMVLGFLAVVLLSRRRFE
ncbi:MAG TPA: hypothetical protein VN764_17930, partial [Polyangiaceae bacterium]|nr:hypothetical protein [Polyangiaceae bacterium]